MTDQPEPDELERVRRETQRQIALEAIAVARAALKSARASGPMETPTQEPRATDRELTDRAGARSVPEDPRP